MACFLDVHIMSFEPRLMVPDDVAAVLHDAVRLLLGLSVGADAIIAFGSVSQPGLWQNGSSDLDLAVFIDRSLEDCLEYVAHELASETVEAGLLTEEAPHFICDVQNRKIKSMFNYRGQHLDVTWATGLVNVGVSPREVCTDNFELFVGNMCRFGIPLLGASPSINGMQELFPYYSESLRSTRLQAVLAAFDAEHALINRLQTTDPCRQIAQLHRLQELFAQALFMARRTYPYSYSKHLHFQFTRYLAMSREDADSLLPWGRGEVWTPLLIAQQWQSTLDRVRRAG
jgi:hypothetical protein